MESEINQVWNWLGSELAAFGVRWAIVGVIVVLFSGFIGKRYKALLAENKAMKQRISDLEKLGPRMQELEQKNERDNGEIRPIDTITAHGVVTVGPTGYPDRLTPWGRMKLGKRSPPPGITHDEEKTDNGPRWRKARFGDGPDYSYAIEYQDDGRWNRKHREVDYREGKDTSLSGENWRLSFKSLAEAKNYARQWMDLYEQCRIIREGFLEDGSLHTEIVWSGHASEFGSRD